MTCLKFVLLFITDVLLCPTVGLQTDEALNVVKKLNFSPSCQQMVTDNEYSCSVSYGHCHYQASEQMMKLYHVLIDSDATMLEINPMTEDNNGQGICLLVLVNVLM